MEKAANELQQKIKAEEEKLRGLSDSLVTKFSSHYSLELIPITLHKKLIEYLYNN
jgi:hypothetical protein